MARLLTIVNERKRILNLYRKHLEDQYIAKKKKEELERVKIEREKKKEEGKNVPLLKEELAEKLKKKQMKTLSREAEKLEHLKSAKENENLIPSITDKDVAATANVRTQQSRGEILRRYSKNTPELSLKEKRVAFSKIQAVRAMQAKEIFLKELSALGKQLGKQKGATSSDFEERKAKKLSGLKRKKDISKLELNNLVVES